MKLTIPGHIYLACFAKSIGLILVHSAWAIALQVQAVFLSVGAPFLGIWSGFQSTQVTGILTLLSFLKVFHPCATPIKCSNVLYEF